MRVYFIGLVCLFAIQTISAQNSSDFYKKAKKALDKYQQNDEVEKLNDALTYIKKSLNGIERVDSKKSAKIWMKAGEIYNEAAYRDYKMLLVDINHQSNYPNTAEAAFDAFQKCVNNADKKWDKSKAMEELLKTATFISNEGIAAYNLGIYDKAYASFSKVLEIRDYLNGYNQTSVLSKKGAYKKHLFRTALSAQKSDNPEPAIIYLEELKDAKYKNSAIYSVLAELYMEEGSSKKALSTIKEGRELYPKDEGLMIAEINYYHKKDALDSLVNKLEIAAEKNPDNVSILSLLGHSYNQLQVKEANKGNFTLAQNYFQQSMQYFTKTLEVDDRYAPALYNLGALYYNKASIVTRELQQLEKDQSAKGIRAFSAKKSELTILFDRALPFFQKAEAVDPNDVATLMALKEIYTRKNNTEVVAELSGRLDQINTGKTIEQGYFDN